MSVTPEPWSHTRITTAAVFPTAAILLNKNKLCKVEDNAWDLLVDQRWEFIKENKKVRKKRKKELDQESDQENDQEKKLFFFS